MRKLAYLLLIISVVVGCKEKGSLPGFSVSESGLEYRLIALGDETMPIKDQDHLVLGLRAFDMNGKELANNYPYQFDSAIVYNQEQQSLWSEGLGSLMVGDSAAFILPYHACKQVLSLFVADSQRIVMHIKVIDRMAPEWFALQKKYPGMAKVFKEEVIELAAFFDTIAAEASLEIGDMFYIETNEGEGGHPSTGDVVRVHYEGFFVSGEKFDSTIDRDESFEYRVGESGQVLIGFNIGVRQLKEGGEAYFVLPADMAFSHRGSTDGTVPPNTTVIYRVNLLSIKHDQV